MDTSFVAFGRVIEGLRVLNLVEKVQLKNERPMQPVVVTDCGRYVP